jgi:hypothetical protein
MQVHHRGFKGINIVFEMAQSNVAVMTKNPPNQVVVMVVIHMKLNFTFSVVLFRLTNGTHPALRLKKIVILIPGDPIFRTKVIFPPHVTGSTGTAFALFTGR